jgi:hypothetical protein
VGPGSGVVFQFKYARIEPGDDAKDENNNDDCDGMGDEQHRRRRNRFASFYSRDDVSVCVSAVTNTRTRQCGKWNS